MQQFASPLLLVAPSSIPVSTSGGQASAIVGSGSGSGRHSTSHHPHSLQILKKHEHRIETELKTLGFGTVGVPLWPNYNDTEIVQAFK